MSIIEQKKHIRQQMRALRQSLSQEQLLEASSDLSNQLKQLLTMDDYPLAMYLSFDSELSTESFLNTIHPNDDTILLPVIQGKGRPLAFREYQDDSPLTQNCYGIGEPLSGESYPLSEIKTICLPLTAFDRRGGRLGMGGGYYDVTLASIDKRTQNTQPKLIGLGYEFQELPECPMEAHDQPLDYVVTPSEVITISR